MKRLGMIATFLRRVVPNVRAEVRATWVTTSFAYGYLRGGA